MIDWIEENPWAALGISLLVALTIGNAVALAIHILYERPDGELGCAFQHGGRWYEGDWTSGTYEINDMYPIADPRLN